ncbi:hypothetical protein SADUNF_Sadunf06G0009900 [Salix dunnii]|uniref:DUF4220 domain-containing protein n=1 Tax=Salix dunnii TaxID=1413687 RepID=A0A835MUI4_9ROSI|nr:hypothetical protein SADUNF_Sadunf06G0009900 [Salix dunnii]
METNVGGEDDAKGNAGLLEGNATGNATGEEELGLLEGNATGEEELGVSADMGDNAVDEEAERDNATEHTSSSQTPLLFVLVDDHSSPENIHEVNSLSPSSNPILDTPVGYKLPARKNRGKPPARYSPSTEGKQSQYPISNHVTTQRLTKPLRDFTDKLKSNMGIPNLPETVERLWNGWELRVVMLLSLFLQMFLILFGRRRKYTAGFWIGNLVWLAYLSADWVATFSLGILAQKIGDSERNCINSNRGLIPAFWAPVLLVHLGGPDTITAYSVEDNELWLRHLLVLVSQVAVAFYAFTRSWWSKDPLLFVAIPIFVAGIIKYGERNWVLRSASSKQYRNSVYREMNELRGKFEKFSNSVLFEMTNERLVRELVLSDIISQAKFLHEAYLFFQMFGVLFADLVLGDSIHLATHIILKEKSAMEAFKLIEVEMGFMYDVLYTKLAKVRSSLVIFRAITFLCFVSALLAFSLGMSKNNHAYLTAEITISYLLLYGAITIEIYSVVLLLISDWAMLWLSGQRKPLFNFVYRNSSFLHSDKRWDGRMAQHNLIRFQLSKGKLTSISLKKLLGKNNIQSMEDVGAVLKDFIFQHLLDKRTRYNLRMRYSDPGRNELHEILSERGDQVIGREECLEIFGWSVKLPDFNESLLTWHIATDICYHDDVRNNGRVAKSIHPNTKISIELSNYMVYLLVDCPFLLPRGMGNERYMQTCSAVKEDAELLNRIISGQDSSWNSFETISKLEGSQSKLSVLCAGFKLAKSLQTQVGLGNERKWEMISQVWVEMLTYAASHCGWKDHAQTLTRGGELVSHVCLLMAHLGLSEQCLTN